MSEADDLVNRVTEAMMRVNEHTHGFTYSQLMREMAIVAVAICGKGTMPIITSREDLDSVAEMDLRPGKVIEVSESDSDICGYRLPPPPPRSP